MALNDIDAKILSLLQQNARISLSELSKGVNLSLSAVSERLKKLENSGIIKEYTAVLDPEMLNRSLMANIRIITNGGQHEKDFLKLMSESSEILELFRVAGSCDYTAKAAVKNAEALSDLLFRIKSLKAVQSAETEVIVKELKHKHSVPAIAEK